MAKQLFQLYVQKKLSESKENLENNVNYDGPPSILIDDEDDVFAADDRDFRKPRACTLPLEYVGTPGDEVSIALLNTKAPPVLSLPKKGQYSRFMGVSSTICNADSTFIEL